MVIFVAVKNLKVQIESRFIITLSSLIILVKLSVSTILPNSVSKGDSLTNFFENPHIILLFPLLHTLQKPCFEIIITYSIMTYLSSKGSLTYLRLTFVKTCALDENKRYQLVVVIFFKFTGSPRVKAKTTQGLGRRKYETRNKLDQIKDGESGRLQRVFSKNKRLDKIDLGWSTERSLTEEDDLEKEG